MENASKALIMAGGVLVGVMIITLAVFLFQNFGAFTAEIEQKNAQKALAEFNSSYTKYEGKDVTAHEIVTAANEAKDNNERYNLTNMRLPDDNSYYIRVDAPEMYNMETKTETDYTDFLKKYIDAGQKFKCEIRFASGTGRVNYVIFRTK